LVAPVLVSKSLLVDNSIVEVIVVLKELRKLNFEKLISIDIPDASSYTLDDVNATLNPQLFAAY